MIAHPIAPLGEAIGTKTRGLNTPSLVDGALSLWRAGHIGAAIAAARAMEDRETGAILEARLALRHGDPADGIALLRHAPRVYSTLERRLEASMILACCFAASGDYQVALDLLHGADVPAALCDEWMFCRALIAWSAGDNAGASVFIAAGPGADPILRMRHADLRGWIAARDGRLADQAQIVHSAFTAYVDGGTPDVGVAASALHVLAALNSELYLPDVDVTVRKAIPDLAWTEDLRAARFQSLHFLLVSEALRGAWLSAFRFAKEAHRLAPSPAWQVATLLDLVFVRRAFNEPHGAAADLEEALDLCASVNWKAADGEERWALLIAAELCAEEDPARAHQLLRQGRDLMATISPRMALRHDRRGPARIAQATGAVLRALGQPVAAERAYRDAFEVYDAIGYTWRAALMALRIHECTGAPSWLDEARERLSLYPDSWIAHELQCAGGEADDPVWRTLTRRQQQVCSALCDGYRAPAIAERLGTSVATVRSHIQAVYAAFDVNSQQDLLLRRGKAQPPPMGAPLT